MGVHRAGPQSRVEHRTGHIPRGAHYRIRERLFRLRRVQRGIDALRDFPDFPGPGEGMVSDDETIKDQEAWRIEWEGLALRVKAVKERAFGATSVPGGIWREFVDAHAAARSARGEKADG